MHIRPNTPVELRQQMEMLIARKLLESMAAINQKVAYANYGDGNINVKRKSVNAILKMIGNCDDIRLIFENGAFVLLVMGNNGYDVISDYTAAKGPFEQCMEQVSQFASEVEYGEHFPVTCPKDVPAWTLGSPPHTRDQRGVCINCGTYHGAAKGRND